MPGFLALKELRLSKDVTVFVETFDVSFCLHLFLVRRPVTFLPDW